MLVFFRMRNYKKKEKPYTPEDLARAIKEVIENNRPIRETALKYGIPRITLQDNVHKAKQGRGKPPKHHLAVFTKDQEEKLANYIKVAVDLFHGLSSKDTRKFAYDCAKAHGVTVPSSWDENKMAGEDWLSSFMKRNDLSIRKAQATSMSRATAFNRQNVADFMQHLADVYGRLQVQASDIWVTDETGNSPDWIM